MRGTRTLSGGDSTPPVVAAANAPYSLNLRARADDDGTVWMTPAMQRRLVFAEPPKNVQITEDLGAGCGAATREK